MATKRSTKMNQVKTYKQMQQIIPDIPASVSGESVTLSPKAKTYYRDMMTAYKKMEEDFNNLATIFNGSKSHVIGSKLISRLTKTASACKTQATNCTNRAKELEHSFTEYSKVQQKIDEMEFESALEEQGWTKVN